MWRRRGGRGARRVDCSPQFLSSRPLGQSLTPSQEGTQSPFTEQRNSPGQAGRRVEVPSGHVSVDTHADASVLPLYPRVHMLCVVHMDIRVQAQAHSMHTVCTGVYTE